MPTANIAVTRDADKRLRTFAKNLETLVPFWRELAEHLADEAQSRWPLRRRSGQLRTSLVWRRDSGSGAAASMNRPPIAWCLGRVCFTAGFRSTARNASAKHR